MFSSGKTIGGKYKLQKSISEGAFSEVFTATGLDPRVQYAVKIEKLRRKDSFLKQEADVYAELKGAEGVPKIFYFGPEGDYYVMVTELVGQSVQTLFDRCHQQLSVPTVFLLAEQMVERVETVHSIGYVHKDIKPDNFAIGKDNLVYLLDFGLAKRYMDKKTAEHTPFRDNNRFAGTAKFASLNAQLGYEQSRRDDLEALGYTLIYLMKGKLPWEGVKGSTRGKKFDKIMDKKMNLPLDRLCKGMPAEIFRYMTHCRGLMYEAQPDYHMLRKEFKNYFNSNWKRKDFAYDWEKFGIDAKKLEGKTTGHESHLAYAPVLKKYAEGAEGADKGESKEELKESLRKAQIQRLIKGLPAKYREIHPRADTSGPATAVKEEKKEEDFGAFKPPLTPTLDKREILIPEPITCDYDEADMGEHCIVNEEDSEAVPSEQVVKTSIMLPMCSYISNAKHWEQNRKKVRMTQAQTELLRGTSWKPPMSSLVISCKKRTSAMPTSTELLAKCALESREYSKESDDVN